jgi:hypothetical protein
MTVIPSQNITPIEAYLPYPAIFFITSFCKAHSFFKKTNRVVHIAENPLNLFFSILGNSLNYTLGSFSIVRIPARAILVAKRVVECVESQYKLVESFREFQNSLIEPIYLSEEEEHERFLPRVHTKLSILAQKIKRVVEAFLVFFSCLFVLSSSYVCLVESFTEDPSDEAVEDFFINSRFFLSRIRDYENDIHKTLQSLGATYKITNITNSLSYGVTVCGFISKIFDEATREICYLFKLFMPKESSLLKDNDFTKNKPKIGLDEVYRVRAQFLRFASAKGIIS